MPPTLASLVQHSSLKLVVRAGEDRLDTPVRWAHVSELADPVPYMEGGELLLTTALTLDAEDLASMRRYVRRLLGAGVVGLGFAVGVNYEEIPPALLAAAREEHLPLLEVPRRTPFLAISKAVSAAISADQYRAVTAGFEVQRELTRAALAEGPDAVVARLAAHVDGWAALYDTSGSVVAVSPDWAARRAARLTPDVERLRARPAPASAVVGGTDDRVELQSLGTGRRVRGALAVGTAAPLGTAERYAVHSAIALLTLTTERSRSLQAAEQRLGAAILRLLLEGQADHARTVAGGVYGGLLDAPFRLLVAEPAGSEPAGEPALPLLAEDLEAAAARAGEAVLTVAESEHRLVVLAGDDGAVVTACGGYAAREAEEAGIVVGLSAPTAPALTAAAYKQAEQALSVARRRGRALVEHEDLAAGSVLPLLADDAVRAFADGMLRALRDHDATGRGDLVASLRAWLSRHGQWDAAAADLGVHRHTLRYRMRRVEEILGRSLDDPDVRMELWLALKATEEGAK
ncbi:MULTISPECIES: PucR family transcriptional regulator [unclassified Streptomyces]|uniref:PucR family transcriptional regulator n=1 Tax=unclassified Streptomyces TaxID=2593676 RepID=UPI001660F407|nr:MULTISPECIES: PucR family transcriptional regulator [unclassified Streptomyces]MBD0711364.1 PucR family transcriptional regulator [Streptomyces sp. CBMA291]MBD0718101.1 PucR family transcriptional regulator [Streptomyces sp. CBMA370]